MLSFDTCSLQKARMCKEKNNRRGENKYDEKAHQLKKLPNTVKRAVLTFSLSTLVCSYYLVHEAF